MTSKIITIYVPALMCVFALAIGQILFKYSATALSRAGSLFDPSVFISLISAMSLYAITSIAWVWVLQKIELGKVYPLMALAFVLVPIASHFVFGEKFASQYFLGITFIMTGIIITIQS